MKKSTRFKVGPRSSESKRALVFDVFFFERPVVIPKEENSRHDDANS